MAFSCGTQCGADLQGQRPGTSLNKRCRPVGLAGLGPWGLHVNYRFGMVLGGLPAISPKLKSLLADANPSEEPAGSAGQRVGRFAVKWLCNGSPAFLGVNPETPYDAETSNMSTSSDPNKSVISASVCCLFVRHILRPRWLEA
jgi:hypothetical protein